MTLDQMKTTGGAKYIPEKTEIRMPHSSRCPYDECSERLKVSNSATNFSNPALSVRIAVDRQMFKPECSVLEVGSGNLRNSLFVMNSVPGIKMFAFELEETRQRFRKRYQLFKNLNGRVVRSDFGKRKYDIAICTFVLETICPSGRRRLLIKRICSVLKRNGILIASFRGYPGVRGSQYKLCPMREGWTTPLNTFIKPHSIQEVLELMRKGGFQSISLLQNYKVKKPQNIHIIGHLGA